MRCAASAPPPGQKNRGAASPPHRAHDRLTRQKLIASRPDVNLDDRKSMELVGIRAPERPKIRVREMILICGSWLDQASTMAGSRRGKGEADAGILVICIRSVAFRPRVPPNTRARAHRARVRRGVHSVSRRCATLCRNFPRPAGNRWCRSRRRSRPCGRRAPRSSLLWWRRHPEAKGSRWPPPLRFRYPH